MKKILSALAITIITLSPISAGFALAASTGKITNYSVGTCKEINGGMWQQLADGTWADPNDSINKCRNSGFPGNWTDYPQYNPWYQADQYGQNGYGSMTQSEWFTRCVLTQSILPRPECQTNPYGLLSTIFGNNSFANSANGLLAYPQIGRNQYYFGNNQYQISASVPQENKTLNSILFGLSMGWMFNRLTS